MATKALRHEVFPATEITEVTERWLHRPFGKRRYVQNPWLFSKRASALSLRISFVGWTLSALVKPELVHRRWGSVYLVFKEQGANSSLVARDP